MKKGRFFAYFLVSFAALLTLWSQTPAPHWYSDALLGVAAVVGPILHGWVLVYPSASESHPYWVYGERRVEASMQFEALAVGVVPLLALLLATPGVPLVSRIFRMALGTVINFMALAMIVAFFPLLVFYKNAFTDVLGTFLGLVAFVGAPVIIWFVLSFRELRQFLPSFGALRVPQPRERKLSQNG